MSKQIGIQLTNDLKLAYGDRSLVVGDTLYQNQYLLLTVQKGEIKEHPMLGVGIADMAGDDELDGWKKTIREEFAKDGLKVQKLTINTNGMELEAKY